MPAAAKKKKVYLHLYDHHDPIWNKCFDEHFRDGSGAVVRSYAEREEMQFDRWLDILPGMDAVCQIETTADLIKYLERNPDRLERVKDLVRKGNLEILGGGTTIIDFNTIHGESVYRNYLYSFKWLQENLGVRPGIADCNDTFGMSAQLPQILTQFGMTWLPFYSRCLGNGHEGIELTRYADEPVKPFWRGIDGSIICIKMHFDEHGQPMERSFVNYQYSPCPVCAGEGCRTCEYSGLDRHAEHAAWALDGQFRALVEGDKTAARFMSHTEETVRTPTFIPDVKRLAEEHGLELEFLTYDKIKNTWAHGYLEKIANGTVPEDQVDIRPDANPIGTGCYVTRGILKRDNRDAEHLLLEAEKFSALASAYGFAYPARALENQWVTMNTLQAHDALTGNHPDGPFLEMRKMQRNVRGNAGKHLLSACRFIAERISGQEDTGTVRVAVFNPLNWAVTSERVEIIIPAREIPGDDDTAIVEWDVTAADGAVQPVISWERVAIRRGPVKTNVYRLDVQAHDLPAMGYATFTCTPQYGVAGDEGQETEQQFRTTDAEMVGLQAEARVGSTGRGETDALTPVGNGRIENDRYAVTFNDRGITGILDKQLDKTVAKAGALDLTAEDDIGTFWDRLKIFGVKVNLTEHADMHVRAWDGIIKKLEITGRLEKPMAWDIPEKWSADLAKGGAGAFRTLSSDEVYCSINHLAWKHEVTLLPGSGRVDIKTTIDADTENIRLYVPFDFGFTTPEDEALFEIPYGMIKRTSYEPQSLVHNAPDGLWPAVHWSAAENEKDVYTCGLLNKGIPGQKFKDGVMELHLHRSPRLHPWSSRSLEDSRAINPLGRDIGKQVYAYALVSRSGNVAAARMAHLGYEFNAHFPAVTARAGEGVEANLPLTRSFLANTADNVIIPVVKKEEKGDGLILRMTEVYGQKSADTVKGDVKITAETDPMEEADTPVDGKLNFRPFEIKTVRGTMK